MKPILKTIWLQSHGRAAYAVQRLGRGSCERSAGNNFLCNLWYLEVVHHSNHLQDELLDRLQCGECPDTTATLGRTALHAAAANANLAAVAALVEHRADVRIADSNGYTALHMACTRWNDIVGSSIHCEQASVGHTCHSGAACEGRSTFELDEQVFGF